MSRKRKEADSPMNRQPLAKSAPIPVVLTAEELNQADIRARTAARRAAQTPLASLREISQDEALKRVAANVVDREARIQSTAKKLLAAEAPNLEGQREKSGFGCPKERRP